MILKAPSKFHRPNTRHPPNHPEERDECGGANGREATASNTSVRRWASFQEVLEEESQFLPLVGELDMFQIGPPSNSARPERSKSLANELRGD